MESSQANYLQADVVARYHRHLQRIGKSATLEQACRRWVNRYAKLWRQHYMRDENRSLNQPCERRRAAS